MSFAIAKQPIFDKDKNVVGYEVYLRHYEDLSRYPENLPYNKATYIVSDLIAELGIQRISEGKRIYINMSLDSILNKSLDLLPMDHLAIELIPPQVEVGQILYKNALKRIGEMKKEGAVIVLTEDLYTNKYVELIEESSIVEFSVRNVTEEKIEAVHRNKKQVFITKIEQEEDFSGLKDKADLFAGNYLGPPMVIKKFELAPFLKSTLMRMLGSMNTATSVKEFADIVASDVGMSAKLLRFVNSAYFSRRNEIKDITQACSYLGLDNLKKFTLLIATNDYISVENPYLWKRSLLRAIIAENLAKKVAPGKSNEAYLTGLFSMIDEILHVDKVEFLKEVNIGQEIIDAYTGHNQILSDILKWSIALEEATEYESELMDQTVKEVANEVNMTPEYLKAIMFEAQRQVYEVLKI